MPSLLLVDDRPQNLLALEAILEPLGHELVKAGSGAEALRALLHRDDFAAILLDVQMPELDGFETAAVIKERERTSTIPIIFLTALSKEERHVFRGYEVGAVDYVFKPFDPEILRAKVSVFIELSEKNRQIREQAEQLAAQELDELRRASAERYRQLADAMPQIVWTADAEGHTTYYNRRWFEYTGLDEQDLGDQAWSTVVHPDDMPDVTARRKRTLVDGGVFEVEYRFRAADGSYRWHLSRAIPIRTDDDTIDFWIGTATDIDDRKRLEDSQRFLLDAGALLSVSRDWRAGLRGVAELAVPRVADRCAIDVLDEDGTLVRLAGDDAGTEAKAVIRSGAPLFEPNRLAVPLVALGRALGAITIETDRSGRRLTDLDLRTTEELALRIASVVENAQLYEEVERRARAARVLETIADGVVLLDREERVILWNAAATAITGFSSADVLGRPAAEVLPGYDRVGTDTVDGRPETIPAEINGRELWLSFSGVRFEDGTVYAFRDLTEERGLEQMRADFVATVSHELRTPLAAIYGAAITLGRDDLELGAEMQGRLLQIVAEESDRLAQIVNDVLLASHLDSGRLPLRIDTVDATKVTESVIEAAQTHLPASVTLTLQAPKRLPRVVADEQHLRQVLVNLVENAIKYSPDGGPVDVTIDRSPRAVRWAISDRGLGIPQGERRRVFEKFYRLDPNMARGIGGTGLGLYICRELVRRFDGRIWVEPNKRKGSTFFVEIPTAKRAVPRAQAKTAA